MSTFIPTELVAATREYLHTRILSQLKREEVDVVHLAILEECPIYSKRDGSRILESGNLYLARPENGVSADVLCEEFYATADQRLKEQGIKPADMDVDHCPALVLEHLVITTGTALIEAVVELTGQPLERASGIPRIRQELLDTTCKFVVGNCPRECFLPKEPS